MSIDVRCVVELPGAANDADADVGRLIDMVYSSIGKENFTQARSLLYKAKACLEADPDVSTAFDPAYRACEATLARWSGDPYPGYE